MDFFQILQKLNLSNALSSLMQTGKICEYNWSNDDENFDDSHWVYFLHFFRRNSGGIERGANGEPKTSTQLTMFTGLLSSLADMKNENLWFRSLFESEGTKFVDMCLS